MSDSESTPADGGDRGSSLDVKIFVGLGGLLLTAFVAALFFILTREEPKPPADDFYNSLTLSDFNLIDRSGRAVTRTELDGKLVVVGFVFTSCGIECTISGMTMAKVQDELAGRDDVLMVSLTVDPMTDTPSVLSKFAEKIGAKSDDWLFLTGERTNVFQTLQASFLAADEKDGMVPMALPAGRLPLVSRMYLLGRTGQVIASFDARSDETPAKVVAAIDAAGPADPIFRPAENASTNVTYSTTGVIRKLGDDLKTAIIRHEEIPRYMPKMTMRLNVRDTNELKNLRAGDEIAFKLSANDDTHWIHEVRRIGEQKVISDADLKAFEPVAKLDVPDSQAFPDFGFLSESNTTVKFSDYRSKALAFTFIFTRCPLPDYCPRMGNRFFEARELLRGNETAGTNWQMLSISFDPEHDTPKILSSYGGHYRKADSDRWLFAVASKKTLKKLAPMCDLQFMQEGGTITHNLRTIVLKPDGSIHRVFAGNTWTAEELANAIQQVATVK